MAVLQTVFNSREFDLNDNVLMEFQGHRRYAHDLKNCMVSIAALASDGGNEEILSLLGDMEVDLDTLTGKRYTSNHILNAILWEKSVLSDRQGVSMDIYGGLLYIEQNGDRFITILTIAKSCLAMRNADVEE